MHLAAALNRSRLAALVGACCLALVCMGCESDGLRGVPMVSGIVDTFEDDNRESALNTQWEMIAEGNGTRGNIFTQNGGYDNSLYSLIFDGHRPPNAGGADVAGIRVSLTQNPRIADPNRSLINQDVSGYTGLAFAIKGTPGTYIVQLGSAEVIDSDNYNTYVQIAPEWTEFKIPFSQFNQEGFGQAIPWNGKYVSFIAFYANLSGPINFTIDNVRFYQE